MDILNKALILPIFVLAGCSSDTIVNQMADEIHDELTLVAEDIYALPPECGEQVKLAQRIELVRERVDIMEEAYIKETDDLNQKNRRLEGYVFTLTLALAVAVGLLVKRLLQRFAA